VLISERAKKMKRRVKLLQLGILMIVSLFVVLSASYSYSKYTMKQHDHLTGTYVDFRLSHDGEGQVALMSTTNEGNTATEEDITKKEYEYIGYITLSVINKKDEKVSQRELAFTLREPTLEELKAKKITDVWGKEYRFDNNSELYDIEIVKANGTSYTQEEKADKNGEYIKNTSFEAKKEKETHLTLQIKRLKKSRLNNESAGALTNIEDVTIVLETSKPYKTTSIFTIKVSNSLIFMNTTKTTYFGFSDVKVNIITAKEYIWQNKDEIETETKSIKSTNPAKIKIQYDAQTILDFERFRLEVENQYTPIENDSKKVGYQYETGNHEITLYVPMGSSINLHFYISDKTTISQTSIFSYESGGSTKTYDYTPNVAGVKELTEGGVEYVYHYSLDN